MKNDVLSRIGLPGSALQLALLRTALGAYCFLICGSRFFELAPIVNAPRRRLTYFGETSQRFIAENFFTGSVTIGEVSQVLALLVAVGLLIRLTLPLLAVSFTAQFSFYYWTTGYPNQWVYLVFPLFLLSFSRCGDRFSLDACFRGRRGASADPQHYRWPVEICSVWYVYIYAAASFAKMFPVKNGVRWLEGGTIKNILWQRFLDSPLHYLFERPLFDYASSYWVFVILAGIAIFTETVVLVVLFTNRFNIHVLILIAGMHLALILTGVAGFFLASSVLAIALLPPGWFPDYPKPDSPR